MDNLKKMNFTELNSSEMRQVQGGGLLEDLTARARELGMDIDDLLRQYSLAELIALLGG
jgi:hypothetical protein